MENRPSKIIIKIEWKAGMFKTVYGNKSIRILFKKEVERPFILVVLDDSNDLEWGDPYFAQPKHWKNQVFFLSDLRYLDNQLKRKLYAMPKINEMLFKLEVSSMLRHLI